MMFVWLVFPISYYSTYSTLYSSQKSPPFLPSPFSYFLSLLLVSSPTLPSSPSPLLPLLL